MRLIGLTGRRGSGKNTAGGFIEEWATRRDLSAVSKGFADKLKHSAALALGFNVAEQDAIVLMDEMKTFGEITTCIPNQSVLYTIEGRKFLQLYGTESHRDIFGQDFWVDALLPEGYSSPVIPKWWDNFTVDDDALGTGFADVAIVTDLRFVNEAERIKSLGGQIWDVYRMEGGVEFDSHISEAGLPENLIDLVIYNNGHDLDRLRDEVFAACNTLIKETTA